jgi:hypothetical protein
MIIPITTNTTIAICIQIQVGDTTNSLPGASIVKRWQDADGTLWLDAYQSSQR